MREERGFFFFFVNNDQKLEFDELKIKMSLGCDDDQNRVVGHCEEKTSSEPGFSLSLFVDNSKWFHWDEHSNHHNDHHPARLILSKRKWRLHRMMMSELATCMEL
jgi:hypothetical protein